MNARTLLTSLMAVLQRLPSGRLWLTMVALSLALAECVTAAMAWLLLGRVTADYLLTGLVASVLVASLVVAIILASGRQARGLAACLAENEERYRSISTLSSDFIFSCLCAEGGCLRMDWLAGSCERLFGLTPDEMKARDCWRSAVLANDLPVFDRHVAGLAPGQSGECEMRLRHTDGSVRHVHVRAKALAISGADHYRLYGSCQDITKRKEVERRLRREHDFRQHIIESLPGIFYVFDAAGRFQAWNRNLEQISGRSAEEIGKAHPLEFIAAADQAKVAAAIERALADGRVTIEASLQTKDGQHIPYFFSGAGIELDGRSALIGLGIDITDRKRIETDLQVAATAFEAQVGIVVTDANGIIVRVNRAFTEGSGYAAAEVVGRNPSMLKSGRHDAAFYAAMWSSIRRSGVWEGEIWDRRKNGEIYPKWLTITAVKGDDGCTSHFVGTQLDITERKAAEEEIKYLAFYDPLTRLPNRRLLLDRLQQALAASARSERQGALLFIDLDNFKTLNHTRGHDEGDLLLQLVGQRLAACVREGDTVARLGGDEFVVMLENLNQKINEAAAQAETVGEKILEALNQHYLLKGLEYHSTASIGVTLFGDQRGSMEELLKQADLAMYQAKAAGRNALRFFDPEMQAAVTARVALERDLRIAVREEQLVLYYQAQVDAAGCLTGAEVLVRWQHPERGLEFPDAFIPLAEETGLILPLGHWVLEAACAQLAAWAGRPEAAHLTLAVNVSVQQIRQPDFVAQVLAVLARSGADPRRLKLELTESLLMDKVEDTIAKMTALKANGVGFALDDFGTGYSSLSYLKRLPLERLKIDRSFVMDVLTDANDAAIAKTIVALAQSLGLTVIAEGVETAEQRDFLADNGCHAYQGYLFSRPLPLEDFEAFLRRQATPAIWPLPLPQA
ncbi:MAG: EAL domain-containing protein [Rhodocyclales bacterium]|nr:EAL domain-containing protein [Rhodocyclales bacterium]